MKETNIKKEVIKKSNYIKLINRDNIFFSDYDFIKLMEKEKADFLLKKNGKTRFLLFFLLKRINKSKYDKIELKINNFFDLEIIRNIEKNKKIVEFNRLYECFLLGKDLNENDLIYSLKNNNLIFYLYDKNYYDKNKIKEIEKKIKEIKDPKLNKLVNILEKITESKKRDIY